MPALRYRIFTLLAVLHTGMIAVVLWGELPNSGPSKDSIELYRTASGLFRDYRFFAPSVASDVRAGFILENQRGEAEFLELGADSREIRFRYNCIIAVAMRQGAARDILARSWATAIFGANPGTAAITVVSQVHQLPSMEDYRRGERPSWQLVYAGRFERDPAQR